VIKELDGIVLLTFLLEQDCQLSHRHRPLFSGTNQWQELLQLVRITSIERLVHLLSIKRIKDGLLAGVILNLIVYELAKFVWISAPDGSGHGFPIKRVSLIIANFIGGPNHLFRRGGLEHRIVGIPFALVPV